VSIRCWGLICRPGPLVPPPLSEGDGESSRHQDNDSANVCASHLVYLAFPQSCPRRPWPWSWSPRVAGGRRGRRWPWRRHRSRSSDTRLLSACVWTIRGKPSVGGGIVAGMWTGPICMEPQVQAAQVSTEHFPVPSR